LCPCPWREIHHERREPQDVGHFDLSIFDLRQGLGEGHAARSVLTANVPPYTIVGGNPARPIKARFSAETVAELEAIAWWDWPVEKISEHLAIIVAADVNALKARAQG